MNKIDINNFNWGWMEKDPVSGEYHKNCMIDEIFVQKIYERFFEVEEGDLVMDFGASVGPFTFSILEKNPSHVYCFEPSWKEIETLTKNLTGSPVTIINKGITDLEGEILFPHLFVSEGEDKRGISTTFKRIIEDLNIDKIDFIKTDCEGGEYNIFSPENLIWIKNNVRKIVGEWHLSSAEEKEKFRVFRDTYLMTFSEYRIFSVDGIDIRWDLWNDHFIEYYEQVIIYIDNR